MHLLEAGNHKVLLDCGLHQGRREEARQRNGHFPFHPHQIDAVVLSHAHIDHCGNLPTLVRQGFDGPIYCTPPTRDLLRVMLADSRQDPGGGRGPPEHRPELRRAVGAAAVHRHPTWSRPSARWCRCPTARRSTSRKAVRFRFIEAGHILGSAMVHLTAAGAGPRPHADVQRRHGPPRAADPEADRRRSRRPTCWSARAPTATACTGSFAETVEKLYAAIRDTVDRGGKVLIPAFSLGRTQLIIHVLQQGLREREDPAHPGLRGQPAGGGSRRGVPGAPEQPRRRRSRRRCAEGHGLLGGDGVTYVRDFEESTLLATRPGPASSSRRAACATPAASSST